MVESGQKKSEPDPLRRLASLFEKDPGVLFAYLFGSCARGQSGPLSDIDLAVFLREDLDHFQYRLMLMERASEELGSDHIDLIVLNDAPVLLQYEVIRDGRILKENKSLRVAFETRVLSRYLDTEHLRKVQRHYLKEQLSRKDDG